MMIHWAWLIPVALASATVGFFTAALCAVAKRADEMAEIQRRIDYLEDEIRRLKEEASKIT